MKDDVSYFAYGSNLFIDQKEERTGTIRQGEDKPQIAHLVNFRLAFNKLSTKWKFAANIMPSRGEEVIGVVYRCDQATMTRMDASEPGYDRQSVQVSLNGGEVVEAITYVAAAKNITSDGHPAAEYLQKIVTGARQHRLPEEYIERIIRLAVASPSSGQTGIEDAGGAVSLPKRGGRMNASDILTAVNAGEDKDREFKSAKGGLPGSMWETYSAMTNTDGGVIVLGIKELNDGSCDIHGLDDPGKTEKNFWSTINDRGKVSANLLANDDVQIVSVDGKPVLVVQVPRASRRQRPVFVGQNPLTGTYRRFNDGDYPCSREEVGRMLADQTDDSFDGRVVEHFGLNDLDPASIAQYRHIFSARSPAHPWNASADGQFLEQIGAWRKDRTAGLEGITFAGLMMFGKDGVISDPDAVPEFHLDYRERLSNDPKVRWTDRIWPDGTWMANLFQFYQRVVPRLTADLKNPFQLQPGMVRKDDTPVHEAIRETFVNSIIHSDFRGQGGIIVEKYRDRFEFSNPGTLLLPVEQILKGGVSECRNRLLQTMFSLLGYGEKAGSGFDKIRQGWASQNWRLPSIEETLQPDRVRVVLPMVSLLPEESVERIKGRFGTKFRKLSPLEVQALVTADLEGGVSNLRMRQICSEHPAELTKLLQGLVGGGFLQQDGRGRGTTYRLPGPGDSSHKIGDSSHSGDSSHKLPVDSSHKLEEIPAEELTKMRVLAAPAHAGMRLPPNETRQIILGLCRGRFLTATDMGELMNRTPQNLRSRFLTPLVEEGLLVRKYPAEPNRPDQAYTTKETT